MAITWNTIGLLSYAAAAGAIILHFSGCAEDLPTSASKSGPDSALVIRPPRGGGCAPEVITSSSETTDTIMTTFSYPLLVSCYPNLVVYGIDMVDSAEVDTPQGNGFFRTTRKSRTRHPRLVRRWERRTHRPKS